MSLVSRSMVNKEMGNHTGKSKEGLATKVTNDYIERCRNKVKLKYQTHNMLICKIGGF